MAGRVSIRLVRCIVRDAPATSKGTALVCPANEMLVGAALPYFPLPRNGAAGLDAGNVEQRASELPSTAWGGMEIGSGMFYSSQVIDGVVGLLGGAQLREACASIPLNEVQMRLMPGEATATPSYGELENRFACILHTVPPLLQPPGVHSEDEFSKLVSCYGQAIDLAGQYSGVDAVAVPLLGSGARGWTKVASSNALAHALANTTLSVHVNVAVRERETAAVVCAALDVHGISFDDDYS